MAEEFLAELNHLHGTRVNRFYAPMMSKYKVDKLNLMLSSGQSIFKQLKNEPMGPFWNYSEPIEGVFNSFQL